MSRNRLSGVCLVGVALSVASVGLASCSSDDAKRVLPPSGDAGEAGEAGQMGTSEGGTAGMGAISSGGSGGKGQAGSDEPSLAGAAGAAIEQAGAGGTASAGAGQIGEGGAGGAACDTPVTGRISIAFDPSDPERVTNLQWTNGAGAPTVNLIAEGGPAHCTDPQEFFGQSYGAPEGSQLLPVVGGHLASLLHCGSDAIISSAAVGCEPAGAAQLPVTTQYHFYDGARENEMRVTRSFEFPATTQIYPGTTGLRPYVPRVALSALPSVIYPNQAGTAVTTVAASSCGNDCITPSGTSWNGKWFADINPNTGLALIVLRGPQQTSAVALTVNNDASSNSNLTSFVLVQPTGGFTAPLSEVEYLCFADLTSWPQTARDSAQLPAGCGP